MAIRHRVLPGDVESGSEVPGAGNVSRERELLQAEAWRALGAWGKSLERGGEFHEKPPISREQSEARVEHTRGSSCIKGMRRFDGVHIVYCPCESCRGA